MGRWHPESKAEGKTEAVSVGRVAVGVSVPKQSSVTAVHLQGVHHTLKSEQAMGNYGITRNQHQDG